MNQSETLPSLLTLNICKNKVTDNNLVGHSKLRTGAKEFTIKLPVCSCILLEDTLNH